MEWTDVLAASAAPITIALLGWVLKLQSDISNLKTRQDRADEDKKTMHSRVDKRDDEISCLDRKVDDIRVELGKIETKLDILLKERNFHATD